MRSPANSAIQTEARQWASLLTSALGLILLLLMAGCQAPATAVATGSAAVEPTNPPSATASPAFTPTDAFSPLTEATRPIVLEPPLPTPTHSPEPPPVNLPDSSIAIFSPGPGSQVLSPVQVLGHGGPSYQERVTVRLLDDQGQQISSAKSILFAYPGNAGRFSANLPFEFNNVSELGSIQVDTFDLRYGRLAHRFTQEVVLLSNGSHRLFPGYQGPAQLAILEPRHDAVIPFGQVQISGGGWTEGLGSLKVVAYDRYGELIDDATVELSSRASGRIGTFETTLTIDLPFSQFGRLAVMEIDPRNDQASFLNSFEVYFRRN
jgi:hypothetical protein